MSLSFPQSHRLKQLDQLTLKLVSWNIMFSFDSYDFRTRNICKIVKKNTPDIICFQEVVPQTWDIIKELLLDEYESIYNHPFINNTSDRCYGEVILTRKSTVIVLDKNYKLLRSCQGRVNTWVDIRIKNDKKEREYRINTGHLESYNSQKYKDLRQKQLDEIEEINKGKTWIWIGDSNLGDDEDNRGMFWVNYTFFSNRFYQGEYMAKYDKIWLSNNMLFLECFNLGDTVVDGQWLSDHDGIYAKISL